MAIFRTFCITTIQDSQKAIQNTAQNPVFKSAPDPTGRFWQSPDGGSQVKLTDAGRDGHIVPKGDLPQNEILIDAPTLDDAKNILSTTYGGMLLLSPELTLTESEPNCQEIRPDDDAILYTDLFYSQMFRTYLDFSFGTLVWDRSHTDTSLLYALEKYRLSLTLDSFTPHSASPRYGQIFENYDSQYVYHTQAAFAFIAAFSAVEEIGMDIRASREKLRFIDGKWNPVVFADIENRLAKIGISPTDTITWVRRGAPTKVEKSIKYVFGRPTEANDEDTVRDVYLSFPEAIQYAAELRNFIAAHKFNELTQYLSPYDVYNIQNLVRLLLLGKLSL